MVLPTDMLSRVINVKWKSPIEIAAAIQGGSFDLPSIADLTIEIDEGASFFEENSGGNAGANVTVEDAAQYSEFPDSPTISVRVTANFNSDGEGAAEFFFETRKTINGFPTIIFSYGPETQAANAHFDHTFIINKSTGEQVVP